jgi:adenylyltransferase/sulfurtransferase
MAENATVFAMSHDRYHRQQLLPQIGREGQRKLARSRVLLIGCGALGTVIAEQLVRAGIGFLRICDRDLVELTNLQRQVLFDEDDARDELPKAVAAARRLREVNSSVRIDDRVIDIHRGNIEAVIGEGIEKAGLILDGTDNVQTRYLVNDAAVKLGIPWVYGACVGTEGRVMGIVPGKTACLRCIFNDPPSAGELPTCDTAGVLASAAGLVGSLQVVLAMKMLLGEPPEQVARLITLDAWSARFRTIETAASRREDCPACGQRHLELLEGPDGSGAVTLCGRNAVQIRPERPTRLNLQELAARLGAIASVRQTAYLLKCRLPDSDLELTIFPDARALIHGTSDLAAARSIYARYVGH